MKLRPPTDYNKPIKEIIDGFLHKNWEPYREYYNKLNFPDIVWLQMKAMEIYDRVHGKMWLRTAAYNEKFILEAFQEVFREASKPSIVLEFGAWNGKLADTVLKYYSNFIMRWHGTDIAPVVVTNNLCKHPTYNPIVLLGQLYDVNLPPHDIFVCSHTLEHLSWEEVQKVLKWQRAKYLVLETPLRENLDGYEGGHVLDVDEEDYRNFIIRLNYRNIYMSKDYLVTAWVDRSSVV